MQTEFVPALIAALRQTEALKQRGQFAAALQLLTGAVQQRFAAWIENAEPDSELKAVDMLALEQLADLALLFAETEAADDLLASAEMWYQRAGNRYFGDYLALKRIHIALGSGALGKARQMLFALQSSFGDVRAIAISESGLTRWEQALHWPGARALDRALLLSQLYLEMGRILAGLGQYREALTVFNRGQHHARLAASQANPAALPHLQLAQVAALVEYGELAQAQQQLEAAHEALHELKQPGLFIAHLELAGKLALLTGRFGEALKHFKDVQRLCVTHGFARQAATASLNLAHVLISLNQTSAARDLLEAVAAHAKALDDKDQIERATMLMQVADARGQSLADGVPIAPSVSDLWEAESAAAPNRPSASDRDPLDLNRSPNHLGFFEDRALAFQWHLGRCDFRAAADALAAIEKIFAHTDSRLIALRLQVMAGMLAYYQHDFAGAESRLRAARNELRALGLKPEQWQVQRFIQWCWTAQGRPLVERQELATDTRRIEEEMQRSLDPADQAFYLLNKWTADEEYIASEINRLAALKKQLQTSALPLRLRRRWQLMKRIHALLEHIDEYKRIVAERTVIGQAATTERRHGSSLWRRLWNHPRDRVTISFLVLPDRVFVAHAGWLRLDFGVSPMTRLQVRDLVRQWHQPILDFIGASRGMGATPAVKPSPGAPTASDANQAMATLKARLNENDCAARLANDLQLSALLKSLPKRIRALTIVPDDSLHGFPFAALIYEGQYLIERYALALDFESRARQTNHAAPLPQTALAVGLSQGAGVFPPLPGVPVELQHVTDWLVARGLNCQRLDDVTSATRWPAKATVAEWLPRATLFHIACHGIFKPDQPDGSGMVFIPSPNQWEVLSLRELSALNLTGLQHATLSSCWSADHFVLPGRWIISLPETLYRAGTHSVLGCLWPVDDRVAVGLMRRFYEYLNQYPRDEALRRAQLDCLRYQLPDDRLADQAHPVFWAGYNLYGDCRRLPM